MNTRRQKEFLKEIEWIAKCPYRNKRKMELFYTALLEFVADTADDEVNEGIDNFFSWIEPTKEKIAPET